MTPAYVGGVSPAALADPCGTSSPRPDTPPPGGSGDMEGPRPVPQRPLTSKAAGPISGTEGPPDVAAATKFDLVRDAPPPPTAPPPSDLLGTPPGPSTGTAPTPLSRPPSYGGYADAVSRTEGPLDTSPAADDALAPLSQRSLDSQCKLASPGGSGDMRGPRPVAHKSPTSKAAGPIPRTEGPPDVAALTEFDLVRGAPPPHTAPPPSDLSGTPPGPSAGTASPPLSRPPSRCGEYADAASRTEGPLDVSPAADDALAPLSPRSLDSMCKLAPHVSQGASPPLGPQGPLNSVSPGQAAKESARPLARRPSCRKPKRKRREVEARPAKRPKTSQPRDKASKQKRKRKLRPTSAAKYYPIFSRQKRPRTKPPRTINANLQKQSAPQGTKCIGANFPT